MRQLKDQNKLIQIQNNKIEQENKELKQLIQNNNKRNIIIK